MLRCWVEKDRPLRMRRGECISTEMLSADVGVLAGAPASLFVHCQENFLKYRQDYDPQWMEWGLNFFAKHWKSSGSTDFRMETSVQAETPLPGPAPLENSVDIPFIKHKECTGEGGMASLRDGRDTSCVGQSWPEEGAGDGDDGVLEEHALGGCRGSNTGGSSSTFEVMCWWPIDPGAPLCGERDGSWPSRVQVLEGWSLKWVIAMENHSLSFTIQSQISSQKWKLTDWREGASSLW